MKVKLLQMLIALCVVLNVGLYAGYGWLDSNENKTIDQLQKNISISLNAYRHKQKIYAWHKKNEAYLQCHDFQLNQLLKYFQLKNIVIKDIKQKNQSLLVSILGNKKDISNLLLSKYFKMSCYWPIDLAIKIQQKDMLVQILWKEPSNEIL